MNPRWKKPVFVSVLLLGLVLVCETTLQVLAALSPSVDTLLAPSWRRAPASAAATEPVIADAVLGHRPNPAHRDHDRNGFRNADVPTRATIVALGDSQTYGENVRREQAWPQQLEQRTGHGTYNMAFGGYGPAHSLVLLPEALALRPRLLVVAFYSGNDLYDCYSLVHDRGQLTALRSDDPAVAQRIRAAEASEPLLKRIEERAAVLHAAAPAFDVPATGPHGWLRRSVSGRSRLYGLLRAAKNALVARAYAAQPHDAAWQAVRAWAASRPADCVAFEAGCVQTVLTPRYRLCALESDDPRIAEGGRIALAAIREIHRRASAVGVDVLVLLIPTKEYVLHEAAAASHVEPGADYARLVACEAALWDQTKRLLDAERIRYVDALPRLRAALVAGSQPYPISHDGHPNALGQNIIAATVADALARFGFLGIPVSD